LQRLIAKITELETLTSQSSRLSLSRYARLPVTKTYDHIRESASDLYSALALGWACNCETQHQVNLLLEVRKASKDGESTIQNDNIQFRFLFEIDCKDGTQNHAWQVGVARLDDSQITQATSLSEYILDVGPVSSSASAARKGRLVERSR
jgi:hypothetical protein